MALSKIPLCPLCNNEMSFDDQDVHFKGCKDNYWRCYSCHVSCITKIRYGKANDRTFYNEQGDIIRYEHK